MILLITNSISLCQEEKKKPVNLLTMVHCDSGLSSSFNATGIKAYEEWQYLATYLQVYKITPQKRRDLCKLGYKFRI